MLFYYIAVPLGVTRTKDIGLFHLYNICKKMYIIHYTYTMHNSNVTNGDHIRHKLTTKKTFS